MIEPRLDAVCRQTAEACAAIGQPVSRVVCTGGGADPLKVYFLFAEVEPYAALMQAPENKDRMIAAFIHALTASGFDAGERPQMSFRFSVDL